MGFSFEDRSDVVSYHYIIITQPLHPHLKTFLNNLSKIGVLHQRWPKRYGT